MEEGSGNGILKELEKEGEKRGLPSRSLEFYQELFDIQAWGEQQIGRINPGLKKEVINERLVRGLPLINYQELALDWHLLNDLFVKVTRIFSDYQDILGSLPKYLTEPKPRKTVPKSLIRAWFKGSKLPKSVVIDSADEYLLLEAIIHATLKPYLVCYARALSPLVNQERWRKNYCPVCGGKPDFSFIDNEKGTRWLVCSRCDSGWLFQRMECPFCGRQEQKDLAYYTDEKGLYRLYVCDTCKKYLKAIDLRATDRNILLPVERILTFELDSQAQAEGYEPGVS